jgi:hypothetical protein
MAKFDNNNEFWITRNGSLQKLNLILDNISTNAEIQVSDNTARETAITNLTSNVSTNAALQVSDNTARETAITNLTSYVSTKQDLLTSSSDLNINELKVGTDSKIFSSSSSFQFQSGTATSSNQFEFMTGSPGEVVYFKAGLGKGVIQTDSIILNGSDVEANIATKQDVLSSSSDIVGSSLTIGGNNSVYQIGVARIGNTGHGAASFSFGNFHSTSSYGFMQNSVGSTFLNCAQNKALHFRVANSQKMILRETGFLGIGTDSPQAPLHIANSGSGTLTQDATNNGYVFVYSGPAQILGLQKQRIFLYMSLEIS